MSGFYRMGEPGQDCFAHINTGRKASGERCRLERFEKDDPAWSNCGRMSVALCDAPGCDAPICERHRTRHVSKPNTDFCTAHKELAGVL